MIRGKVGNLGQRAVADMTAESGTAPLRSPTFVVSLAVLVANDYWLKGAALLPGWLTGKLSDFAGLVVAPLLLVVLLAARKRATKIACFAGVAVSFAALELSPRLASEVERVTRLVGLGWRLWPDPTDLLALGVLPLAWRALHPERGSAALMAPVAPRWVERIVGMLAISACLATSSDSSWFESSISLLNTTHGRVKLQVFRPAALDCDEVAADPASSLSPADFELEACATVAPLEARPLDWDWRGDDYRESPRVIPPGAERTCDAVLLRAQGLDDVVLFWSKVTKVRLDRVIRTGDDDAHLVYLEKAGPYLVASPPAAVQAFTTSASPPAAECPEETP